MTPPMFDLDPAGPIVYMRLPGGKDRLSAAFRGMTATQSIMIAGLSFRWKGAPESVIRFSGSR